MIRALSRATAWTACLSAIVASGCGERVVLDLYPCEAEDCSGRPTGGAAQGGSSGGAEGGSAASAGASAGGCGTLLSRVHTTYPTLPAAAVASDEYHPMLLAARSDDTSLLGYKEAGAARVKVVALDATGEVSAEVFEAEGEEAHALLAHDTGGALVYMRDDPDIYSSQHCRGTDTPGAAVCGSLELVRFDDLGEVTMSATLTDEVTVDDRAALFIWWFEHTARLVWADNTYGVYFRSAAWPSLYTDDMPHPTDTLRFIDETGNRLDRGWSIGCTPSWGIRLAYNGFWAAVCHGDISPTAHRVSVFDDSGQRDFTFLEGVPPRDRALGGVANAADGFWLSYLVRGAASVELHLARVTDAPGLEGDHVVEEATDLEVVETPAYVFQAHLAGYGDDLLLGWESGGRLVLAVADFDTGDVIEGPVATDAPIDSFVDFVTYPGGDVGWAHSEGPDRVSVTRVRSCRE